MSIIVSFFLFVTFLLSCQKEEDLIQPSVDGRLTFFFESFKKEGALRGHEVNMKQIFGNITEIQPKGVLGRCNQSTTESKQLLLDSLFWISATFSEKEYIIFHELGHCALNRRHLDTKNADGTCLSMMQSGNGSCKMNYNTQNRARYLDELFSQ
jgi:hypothetical protein